MIMREQLEKFKKVFSLNNYETKLYWAALKFEAATLSELARKARIPRTAAYTHIQSLVDKGFLLIIKIGKRKKIFFIKNHFQWPSVAKLF